MRRPIAAKERDAEAGQVIEAAALVVARQAEVTELLQAMADHRPDIGNLTPTREIADLLFDVWTDVDELLRRILYVECPLCEGDAEVIPDGEAPIECPACDGMGDVYYLAEPRIRADMENGE